MRLPVPLGVALGLSLLGPQPLAGQLAADGWNGYVQARFTETRDVSGFSLRRAKLWVKDDVPFADHLHYKIQGLFRSPNEGAFTLQDAYVEYRFGLGAVRAGQMVPAFSLERNQPDAVIPLVERAAAIDALIPSATSGARDIGAQITLRSEAGGWQASIGMFNGNGGDTPRNEDKNFLFAGRATYTARLGSNVSWELGGSAAYRRTDGLVFERILGTPDPFAGEDVRWGIETHVTGSRWELQSEYLRAQFGGPAAWGYYVLADYDPTPQYQLAISTERLSLPNPAVPDEPWYIVGLNRFFSGHRAKVMFDARVAHGDPRTRYAGTAQFQLLFK